MTKASTAWWFRAIVFGQVDTSGHEDYTSAVAFTHTESYNPKRLAQIRQQTELTWKMADEGLARIHDRIDKLLTTSLTVFGLSVTALQLGRVAPSLTTYIAVGALVCSVGLLLLSRLPILRFAPTDLPQIVADSTNEVLKDPDDFEYQLAVNYYLARVECDIAASVLGRRMTISIVLLLLALALLAIALL